MKTIKVVVLSLIFVSLLVGCGQTDPPTTDDIQNDAEWFTLTTPDGEVIDCVMYGSMSTGSQDSKSWFGFDCDWGESIPVEPSEPSDSGVVVN